MTLRKLFIATLCIAYSIVAYTQINFDQFDGIQSSGPIPSDLRLTLDELYAQDKQRARDYNDGKLKNRDQVLSASYSINKLTASGRVLYGDPITTMLNSIADTLLHEYPDLRESIHIYTIKSPEVNAFITGQGMLFVTTGLVAQVESEAQLAFVISHEVIHYYRNHNWENITKKHQTKARSGESKTQQELRDFVRYHNRSHAMENESDSLGLEMFYIPSPYDKRVTERFFDVLQYGYLPFDELPLSRNHFNTPYYHFSETYFLDSVAPITARDDYDDSRSTHPNIQKRRSHCADILQPHHGGSEFIVTTRQQFIQLRDLARLECIRQNLIYADYTRAYYDILVMQRYMPNNSYLAKAKAKALYGLSKFKTYEGTSEAVGNYRNVEGEMQQVYYFFSKIKKEELALLATRELCVARAQFPKDTQITLMLEDAIKDLTRKYSFGKNSFSTTFDTITVVDTTRADSKYDKIKKKKQQQNSLNQKRYFFTDLMAADNTLKPYFDYCMSHSNDTANVADTTKKNMLVYASQYFVVDDDGELKTKESDHLESRLTQILSEVAKLDNRDMVDFSDQGLRKLTTSEEYNDFVILNEWVNEFWQSKGAFSRQLSLQPNMNSLATRYNADRINLTTVANIEGQKPYGLSSISLLGILVPISWPFIIAGLSSGYETSLIQTIYADANTGQLLSSHQYKYSIADSKSLVKGTIYDNMLRSRELRNRPFLNRHIMVDADLVMAPNRFAEHQGIIEFSTKDNLDAMFQIVPQLNIDYLLNDGYSIHASAMLRHTSMNQTYNKTINSSYTELQYVRCHHSQTVLALGFRRYRQLNPLGTYWGLNAQWHKNTPDLSANPNLTPEINHTIHRIGLNIDMGRNYIYFDRLVFNIGMNITFIGALPFSLKFIDMEYYNQDPIKHNNLITNKKLWIENIFTIHLGLGLLPF